ncbi:plasmid partitioning protein RepB [Pseudooceanicola sp. MF1-13]|uniref:plasmid partitioning protein RepB n=1 Tax=Pseudooceanicola sp. MF1-13 TaxID=3379095 RepID=UPI0038914063
MARKDLLKGLMGDPLPKTESVTSDKLTAVNSSDDAPSPARPRYSKGAIGAVSQSIAELKSRALVEVHPDMIDPGGIEDRLEEDRADQEKLQASLKAYGQQVPVLLRPDPNSEGRFQIVYGRRRIAAMRALNMPVKAMVRDMTDHDLVIAQGQENAARRDLTFIEKANFARQMRDEGYDRKVICDALHIDKTVISRMLSVVDALPLELIRAIGPAPSAGRDRWMKLADLYANRGSGFPVAGAMKLAADEPSDQRFEAALAALSGENQKAKPKPEKPEPRTIAGAKDQVIAQAKTSGRKTTLTFDAKQTDGFEDWLIDNLSDIHRDWLKARGE